MGSKSFAEKLIRDIEEEEVQEKPKHKKITLKKDKDSYKNLMHTYLKVEDEKQR